MRAPTPTLPIEIAFLKPGLRLAVGVSGGADSVALLRALADRSNELGLVLHAAHLHHGLRGAEADADLEFVRSLAVNLGVVFHHSQVDVAAEAAKTGESIEEAARRLRYGWFRALMASGQVDAVATAHTSDDQAETVLAKFLRGAWTEGLSGIHPIVEFTEGRILRPLLNTPRAQVESYLNALGQPWREDSSNSDPAYTRNRIRHDLLPLLESWNPRLRDHLSNMASLAREEDAYWHSEMARLAPQLLLPGRPVRGGGRAAGDDSLALDVTRLAFLVPAVQRRLLRHAAQQLGATPDFAATEALRSLALTGRAGQKCQLAHGLHAERTPRELRLSAGPPNSVKSSAETPEYQTPIPGEINAPAFALALRIEAPELPLDENSQPAILRNWKPGDRVTLRHSAGPRKVKEVLERLKVTGSSRALWPVLEIAGRILWMKGVELEPEQGIRVTVSPLESVSNPLPTSPSQPQS